MDYVDHDWIADPWSEGCYVGLPVPGALSELGPMLTAPHGSVHWAGTESAPQWGVNVRRIPGNVQRHLNYFSRSGRIGTDPLTALNFAHPEAGHTQVENIAYPVAAAVGHLETVRCYPSERVHALVRELFLERLLRELAQLAP